MAQVLQQDDDKKQEGQVSSTAPTLATGQSATIGQAAPRAPQQQRQAGSGRFQNLQRFIGANLQAPKEYEEKISGRIAGQAERAQERTQAGLSQAQQQTQQELQRLQQGRGLVGQIGTQATQLAADPSKLAALDRLRRGQTAQIGLGDVAGIQQDIAKTQQLAGLTQTEEGRKGLLRQAYGLEDRPIYGSGASRLDQLLLQADPTAAGRLITGAQQAAEQAQTGLETAQQQVGQFGQQIGTEAQQAQQALQQAVTGGMQQLRGTVEQRGQAFNREMQRQADVVNRALQSGQISQSELATLDPDFQNTLRGLVGQSITDVDTGLAAQTADLSNLAQFATADEASRQRALERIGGTASSFLRGATGARADQDFGLGDIGLQDFLRRRESRIGELAEEQAAMTQEARDEFTQQQQQALADAYYREFGRHTGQGFFGREGDLQSALDRALTGEVDVAGEAFKEEFIDPYLGTSRATDAYQAFIEEGRGQEIKGLSMEQIKEKREQEYVQNLINALSGVTAGYQPGLEATTARPEEKFGRLFRIV